MKFVHTRLRTGQALAVGCALLVVATVGAAGASAQLRPAKSLSVSNVTIGGAYSGDFGQEYIAQAAGFFKQQGLKVSFDNIVGQSAAANVTAFLGGAFSFLNNAAGVSMLARQQGGPFEAVFADDEGQQQEITINQSSASQLHIPAADSSPAQALAQFKAMKGSHIVIAVTGTTATTYLDIVALCKLNGLTCGVNAPSDDINIDVVGTATNQTAGYSANKFPAYASNPPTSVQSNAVTINLGEIAPASTASGLFLMAMDSFVEQHSDTVQAVVNAMVEAWAYVHLHQASAERMFSAMQAANGVTSPDEDSYLWNDTFKYWKTPLMLRSSFQAIEKIVNLSSTPPLTLTYNQWCQSKFVEKAVKTVKLGIAVPTSV